MFPQRICSSLVRVGAAISVASNVVLSLAAVIAVSGAILCIRVWVLYSIGLLVILAIYYQRAHCRFFRWTAISNQGICIVYDNDIVCIGPCAICNFCRL